MQEVSKKTRRIYGRMARSRHMEIQSAEIRSRNIIIRQVKNFKEKEVDKEKRRYRGKEEKKERVSRFHSPLLESEMFGGRVIFLRCLLRQRRIP